MSETYSWYTKWCEPLIAAMYLHDESKIQKLLGRVKGALAAEIFNVTTQEFLQHQIAYLEYQCNLILKDPRWEELELDRILSILEEPSEYAEVEMRRRTLYIQLRISLDRKGQKKYSRSEFDKHFGSVIEEQRDTELWNYITEWAFKHDERDIVEEAYEYALLQGKGFYASWTWQKIHIMWKLSTGSANRDDMAWIIKSAEIITQLHSLKNSTIWQRASRAGLTDKEIDVLYQQHERHLMNNADQRVINMLSKHMKQAPDRLA